MPHRAPDKILKIPAWVDALDNGCLRETAVEALIVRDFAVKHGAENHAACKRVLVAADSTLDSVALGRVTGDLACRKAATALRKYNSAAECVHPTARKERLTGEIHGVKPPYRLRSRKPR